MNRNMRMDCKTKEYMGRYVCILRDMIRGMAGAGKGCSLSENFICQMLAHHRAAVELSENLLSCTDSEKFSCTAQKIIAQQTASIEALKDALCCCAPDRSRREELCEYNCQARNIMKEMFEEMNCACEHNAECSFIRQLKAHHMGGIRLVKAAACRDLCCRLEDALESMICGMEKGLEELRCAEKCCR